MDFIATTSSTWSVIGILGAFSLALLGITWKRMDRIENKIDVLHKEMREGEIGLRQEIREQTARIDQQTSRIDWLIEVVTTHRHDFTGSPTVPERAAS